MEEFFEVFVAEAFSLHLSRLQNEKRQLAAGDVDGGFRQVMGFVDDKYDF